MNSQGIVLVAAAGAAAAFYFWMQGQASQADYVAAASDGDASGAGDALIDQSPVMMIEAAATGYLTEGLRNNNPGNLRWAAGQTWLGQIGHDGKGYVVFDAMGNGCRAMCRTLDTFRNSYGLVSVSGIISRYAPSSENDTAKYISDVCGRLSVTPDGDIGASDPNVMLRLIHAIIHHENGYDPVGDDVVMAGINAARA